jgi:hypothetical protein
MPSVPESTVAETITRQMPRCDSFSLPDDQIGCNAANRGAGSGRLILGLALVTAVVAAVLMNAGIARADTIQSFSISGTGTTYGDGPFSFNGDMSIDVTTHTLASIDLGFAAAADIQPAVGNTFEAYVCGGFTGCPSQGFGTVEITMTFDQDDGFYSGGSLVGSLIPIATAEISKCGIFAEPCLEQITGYSGEVTPTTPLPAALPLFATGLGAMGLFGWRNKRKKAANVDKPLALRD